MVSLTSTILLSFDKVLEIAALPDHLLDECQHRNEYAPCDITGEIDIISHDSYLLIFS
jgi:hypothetical protein